MQLLGPASILPASILILGDSIDRTVLEQAHAYAEHKRLQHHDTLGDILKEDKNWFRDVKYLQLPQMEMVGL